MPPNPNEPIRQFIERLRRLPPGDRARLKRNAGKTLEESHQAAPLFFRLLPPVIPVYDEAPFFLLATLYPLAPPRLWDEAADRQVSLGATLRQLQDDKNSNALDRRFEVLLDADEQQLPYHLRQIVRRLGSRDIPVQWEQLLSDLRAWGHPDRYVQRRWARDYFRAAASASEPTPPSNEINPNEEN